MTGSNQEEKGSKDIFVRLGQLDAKMDAVDEKVVHVASQVYSLDNSIRGNGGIGFNTRIDRLERNFKIGAKIYGVAIAMVSLAAAIWVAVKA